MGSAYVFEAEAAFSRSACRDLVLDWRSCGHGAGRAQLRWLFGSLHQGLRHGHAFVKPSREETVADFDEDSTVVCATNGGGMKFTRRMADMLRVGFIMADRFRQKGGGRGLFKQRFK